MSKTDLCQGQLDVILKITEENEQRRQEYNTKKEDFDARYAKYQQDLKEWETRKEDASKIPDERGRYVEAYGKAVDCTTLDSFFNNHCCRDVGLERKKCTLQGDKYGIAEKKGKCSNGGVCTWFGRGLSCTDSNVCADADPNYVRNFTVGNSFPVTESRWHKTLRFQYPEPLPPTDEPVINLDPYPTIICQDCSTSLELIKNTDTLATGMQQMTQCINNLDIQENQEPGDEFRNDINNSNNSSNSNNNSNSNNSSNSNNNSNSNNSNTGNENNANTEEKSLFTQSVEDLVNGADWTEENKKFVLEWWWWMLIGIGVFIVLIFLIVIFSGSGSEGPVYRTYSQRGIIRGNPGIYS